MVWVFVSAITKSQRRTYAIAHAVKLYLALSSQRLETSRSLT